MTDWERPKPPQELQKLAPLIGQWISEDTHFPMPWMPTGGAGSSSNTFINAVDGYCFLSDFKSETPFGLIVGHGIWFYDIESQKYRIQWYDNFGNHLQGEGVFKDSMFIFNLSYRMSGQDILERHTIKNITENSYDFYIETYLDGEFKNTSELKYKRVTHKKSSNLIGAKYAPSS